jgi:PAS domain S-box-containing protein
MSGLALTGLIVLGLALITQRRTLMAQVAQAHQDGVSRLTAVLASSVDAIVLLDQTQRITQCNAVATRMFGAPVSALLGQPLETWLATDCCAAYRAHMQQVDTQAACPGVLTTTDTLYGLRQDGDTFPIEIAISRSDTMRHPSYTVVLRDLTQQHQTAHRLRTQATLAELKTVVSQAAVESGTLVDMLHVCTTAISQHIDTACIQVWTFHEADNVLELQTEATGAAPADVPPVRVPVGQGILGMIAQERELYVTNAVANDPHFAEQAWVHQANLVAFAGYPLTVGPRLFGVIALYAAHPLEEITLLTLVITMHHLALGLERFRIRAALYESEQRFRQLVEHLREVLYLFEVDSEQILYINPAYEQLWGRSAQALYQQATDFIEAVQTEDRAEVYTMLEQHKRSEHSQVEYRVVQPNGEVRWIADRSFPFRDPKRGVLRVAGIAEDITAQKQAEAVLHQTNELLEQRVAERTAALSAANAELARATRLKDEFLASMSHELRTPLNAILGLSEALQEQVYGSLTTKQRQSLRRIEESGRHLLELITDILDLSKIAAGKVELQMTTVNIAQACQASIRLIQESAQQKRLSVTLRLDPQVHFLVADERRLKQMCVNLLSNAVKFTPPGGSIGLEVTGYPDAERLHVTVWDTGIGIAEADVERLFQPFVQLDSSLARHHDGTGLGLSLVARLAALHGGQVALESTVGAGSRFSLIFPWHQDTSDASTALVPVTEDVTASREILVSTAATAASGPPLAESAPGPLLLLAEDNEMNIAILREYLLSKGYRLAIADNGAEVLLQARALRPALILMDIQMPDMDGLEAMQRLRADADTDLAATPVIALTALAMPGDRERCLAAGANDYVCKPYRLRELLQLIQSLLPA